MILMIATLLRNIFYAMLLTVTGLTSCQHTLIQATDNIDNIKKNRAFYFNTSGNDANDGSKHKPWKTITKLNNTKLLPGDTVYFEGGQSFSGSILLTAEDAGTMDKPIIITY